MIFWSRKTEIVVSCKVYSNNRNCFICFEKSFFTVYKCILKTSFRVWITKPLCCIWLSYFKSCTIICFSSFFFSFFFGCSLWLIFTSFLGCLWYCAQLVSHHWSLWVHYGQCSDSSLPSGRCLQWCWMSNLDLVHWYSNVWMRDWVW